MKKKIWKKPPLHPECQSYLEFCRISTKSNQSTPNPSIPKIKKKTNKFRSNSGSLREKDSEQTPTS
jgi:hypothetical protein